MADAHQDWLARLDEQSRKKQEAFMNGIASKLKRPRVIERPAHPFRGAPEFWQSFEWPVEERIERFTRNFEAVGGHALRVRNMDEAKSFIAAKAEETGAKYVLRQQQSELAMLDDAFPGAQVSIWNNEPAADWKATAAQADIGIVIADYAAAYTGSLIVTSASTKGRSVSLLPTMLIALIPVDRLRTRPGEVLMEFDLAERENLPAGIHFISGPSRSADIENDLTIGVHGPGIVYAIIIDKLH